MSKQNESGKIESWPTLSSKSLLETRIFALTARQARSPRTGATGEFYVLEMADWVNVIALTDEGEVLLVRQYRHGSGEVTLEIPGGLVDAEDADPIAAARRELVEETGYDAAEVVLLGSVAPNPALQPNRCHTCLATGLRRVGEQRLDPNEDIEIVREPLTAIPELIASGAICHALVVCAFVWFLGFSPPA